MLEKLKEFEADNEVLMEAALFLNQRSIALVPKVEVTVCRDPEDNFILELAETCQADYIVTRDKDLLELPGQAWRNTQIVKPEAFLPLVRRKKLAA